MIDSFIPYFLLTGLGAILFTCLGFIVGMSLSKERLEGVSSLLFDQLEEFRYRYIKKKYGSDAVIEYGEALNSQLEKMINERQKQ